MGSEQAQGLTLTLTLTSTVILTLALALALALALTLTLTLTRSIWAVMAAWLLSPLWFNPSAFDVTKVGEI